jgi:pimeloyl-ACP methyl ester carboxylesterase
MSPLRLAAIGFLVFGYSFAAFADSPAFSKVAADSGEGYVKAEYGIYLFFKRMGHGPRVIVAPLQFPLYDGLKNLASSHRTLVFYDVRNRGLSTAVGDDSKISIQHDIADVEAIRRFFGADRFSSVGFSYAGLMVALYAMDHPDRVERLVQLGPVPLKFPTQYRKEFMPDDGDRVPDPAAVRAVVELKRQGLISSDARGYCEREWAVTRFGLLGDPSDVDRLGPGPCSLSNE